MEEHKEKINKGIRCRLYPTTEQEQQIWKTIGCCRSVYNSLLSIVKIDLNEEYKQRGRYNYKDIVERLIPLLQTDKYLRWLGRDVRKIDNFKERPSKFDFGKIITQLKHFPEFEFLNQVQAAALLGAGEAFYNALDKYYKNRFKNKGKDFFTKGFPKPKKRGIRDSYAFSGSFCGNPTKADIKAVFSKNKPGMKGFVQLPVLKKVNAVLEQKLEGTIKRACVFNEGKQHEWYVSLIVETELPNHLPKTNKVIGIDMGSKKETDENGKETGKRIVASMIDGNGVESVIKRSNYIEKLQKKLTRLQRILQHKGIRYTDEEGKERIKKENRNNYNKVLYKIKQLHTKIARARNHSSHTETTNLIRNYDLVVIEDLSLKQMQQSKPEGDTNKQAAGLHKGLSDVAPYQFRQQLAYKAKWYGKNIEAVNPKDTSKTCSHCGYVNDELTLADREWVCPKCGKHLDRDINAAKNILNKGIEQIKEREQGIKKKNKNKNEYINNTTIQTLGGLNIKG